MVELHIQKNQGITSAIKTELKKQGYDTNKITGSIWSGIMNEVSNQNTQNIQQGKKAIFTGGTNLYGDSHKNFVVKEGIIELAQNVWNKIISLVTGKHQSEDNSSLTAVSNTQSVNQTSATSSTANIAKINSVRDTRSANEVEPPADKKQNVEEARDYLTNQLTNLTNEDLQTMGISSQKRDRILEYLKNITWGNAHDSAEAKGSGIVFSIHCEDTQNLANMVTLLMHEANHCDENYLDKHPEDSEPTDLRHRDSNGNPLENHRVNTKEEEKACETLGLLATATLIKKGVLQGYDNYGRYGNPTNPVTKYLNNPSLLKSDVNNWANEGYTNYPEGINDASITIEHLKTEKVTLPDNVKNQKPLQLKSGDIIRIGDKSYTLGGDNGIVLSALDSIPVFQMIRHGNVENGPEGILTFNELSPCKEELNFYKIQTGKGWTPHENPETFTVERNGEIIYTGKKY